MRSPDELYEEEMGRPGETRFPDDPDWRYRGSKGEREELEERIRGEEHAYLEGQEELFAE